ncbi:MAG: 2-oxoacid:ferredoxin oxidoreductase subunit beta [Phycisphaerae bacterium]|nr:2-oxoacid:ferredoxin oxidoreductase subunit beta [Phycisphaerae bacterium]
MNTPATASEALTVKDFTPARDALWCPGCGDHAILAVVKRILVKTGAQPENTVIVSGIGCSSRFPYYVNTYGFHSIHGRAPAIATGLKIAAPELNVWVITGDGDGLAIGGNHLMHMIRRNVDVRLLLFNNRIYGLTKGQYSPTSEYGKKTKSSPRGTVERPVRPLAAALGAEATFVARTMAGDPRHLEYVLERAAAHRGTSFVEIYQNCVIFNEGAYEWALGKENRANNVLYLEQGKPLVFGTDGQKAIVADQLRPTIVNRADVPADRVLVHDEKADSPALAFMLSSLTYPDFPEPLGVFRDIEKPCLESEIYGQIEEAIKAQGTGDADHLLSGTDTWKVAARPRKAQR